MSVTKEQVVASINLVRTVADIIKELGEVPSGHLYAQLMPYNISLQAYETIIRVILSTGLVQQKNHLLIWIG